MFLDNLRHSSISITWFWAQIVECGERSSPYPRDGNLPVSATIRHWTAKGERPLSGAQATLNIRLRKRRLTQQLASAL